MSMALALGLGVSDPDDSSPAMPLMRAARAALFHITSSAAPGNLNFPSTVFEVGDLLAAGEVVGICTSTAPAGPVQTLSP
jgi:hypothetical protein